MACTLAVASEIMSLHCQNQRLFVGRKASEFSLRQTASGKAMAVAGIKMPATLKGAGILIPFGFI
jgi:hypothetical protein